MDWWGLNSSRLHGRRLLQTWMLQVGNKTILLQIGFVMQAMNEGLLLNIVKVTEHTKTHRLYGLAYSLTQKVGFWLRLCQVYRG